MSGSNRHRIALRICEAPQQDGGRAIARMTTSAMSALGLADNDLISLTGTRHTVARVLCVESEAIDDDALQIDGILRDNAGAGIGERVDVVPVTAQSAHRVTLIPAGTARTVFHQDERSLLKRFKARWKGQTERRENAPDLHALRRAVESIAVTKGDRVRASVFGRPLDFTVAATVPDGAVIFAATTEIRIAPQSAAGSPGPAVSYEDIGGLGKEIARVREMIELPLRYPEIFERLGVDAPKGVLLYGPPGCGKTLIARAVAYEAGVRFVNINGPEIIQQGYGESEAMLRKIFQEAQESPATIIFFDEIDALAPNRDTVLGDVEKRVVAQLLALMDGINSRGKVIVIAATNLPNNIDPALRRPGRFDREIGLNPPDKRGRLEILQVHTRGMPRAEDVDLQRIAEATHGFLGADLAALCREAAMLCARDVLPKVDFAHSGISEEALALIRVEMKHFDQAMNEIELSTTRQVFTEVPNV